MAPHHRQCYFCGNNTRSAPNIVVFTANDNMKKHLKLSQPQQGQIYICEVHFWNEDLKKHGDSKRLVEGAVPVFFPREEARNTDHMYVLTAPMDMVKHYIKNSNLYR